MTLGAMQLVTHQALDIARELCALGMPMFLGQPDESEATGFRLPGRWQSAVADPRVVDLWEPGMALCAVTGHVLDLIDVDPRSGGVLDGGTQSIPVLAQAQTPSGGQHRFVLPLGVASRDGVWPGVDIKSGQADGAGRGFAFLSPTVRRSKVDGKLRPYVWDHVTNFGRIRDGVNWVRTHGNDGAGPLLNRIAELRAERAADGLPRRLPQSVARVEWDRAYERLVADLAHWARNGWGGEAHAGLLAHTTHLARLSPEGAPAAFAAAFAAVGLAPDDNDLAKLDSALGAAVPDVVVADADMDPQELFWAGASALGGEQPPDPRPAGPEHARAGGFQFLNEFDLARIPVPDALVDGLLWQDSVARMFGPSTVGKTWVSLDIAAHVANGMPWQGHEVRQAPVIYVAAEGAPSIGPRLSYWRDFHGRNTNVLVWPEPVAIGGPHWAEFVAACAEASAGLVVLDTQSAMTVGRKENDNDDAGLVLDHLKVLARATRACVFSVHHNGYADDGRSRGASAMFNGLDTELQLMAGRGGQDVVLLQRKQRYAEKGAPIRARLGVHGEGLVVLPVDGATAGHDFLGVEMDVRAQALYERLLAWEQAGGAVPPKMGMRDMRKLITEEMNEVVENGVKDRAIWMFKRSKGLPVASENRPDA